LSRANPPSRCPSGYAQIWQIFVFREEYVKFKATVRPTATEHADPKITAPVAAPVTAPVTAPASKYVYRRLDLLGSGKTLGSADIQQKPQHQYGRSDFDQTRVT